MLEPDRNGINNNLGEVSEFFLTRTQYHAPSNVAAYYQLPVDNYQIEWKFRGELLSSAVDLRCFFRVRYTARTV